MSEQHDSDQRVADFVTVPCVVGLPFLTAREVAGAAGVSLANPDADGPPISAIAWPHNPIIDSQLPKAGALSHRWDSLRVWLRSDHHPEMARQHDSSPPSASGAYAEPEYPTRGINRASDILNSGADP
jgi:hypothetical protein